MKSIAKLSDLEGRTVIITGGAGHLGSAMGEGLVELGARVAVLDLDAAACEKQAAYLSQIRKDSAIPLPCDLKEEQAARNAIHDAVDQMGRLDILIHCAAWVGTTEAAGWAVPFEEQTVEAWDAAMRINLTSAFVLVQEAQDALVKSGHGSVILIGSTYGLVGPDMSLYEGTGMSNAAGYGASKGGILQLMRYLATVLAPKIRVNAITPGGVWRDQPEAFHRRYVSRTPLARMATEEDMKGAAAYLASDLSAYVTGHNLVVDGGWTAW